LTGLEVEKARGEIWADRVVNRESVEKDRDIVAEKGGWSWRRAGFEQTEASVLRPTSPFRFLFCCRKG